MVLHQKEKSSISSEIREIFNSNPQSQLPTDTATLYKMLDDVLFTMNESTNISITNHEGTILYVNDKFCELSKFEKSEIIGHNHRIVSSGMHSKVFFKRMWETIRSGEIWRGEIQNKAKDDSIYWVFTTIIPLLNEQGQPYQFVSFQADITHKKQIETKCKTNFIRTFQKLPNGIFKVRKALDGTFEVIVSEGDFLNEIGIAKEIVTSSAFKDVAKKAKFYKQAFEGQRVHYEFELNGKFLYVDLNPLLQNGIVTEVMGTVYDFSEFADLQKQLKVNEERYQSLIHYSHEYITTIDKDGSIIHMNRNTMELLGVQEDVFGNLNVVKASVEGERPIIADYFKKAMYGEVQFFEFEIKINGQRKFLNVTLVPIVIDNEIDGVYSIGKDITDEKLVQERNAYLAHHDELTGLPNRRWMEQKIKDSLKEAEENKCRLAILSLDLDRFKSINDTLGHFVGDELLQKIADCLQNNAYREKIHVARMGGDEFMIICTAFESENEVTEIAQHILESLENPIYVQGAELLITASIGIVFYPESGIDVTKLMKRVDTALYKSKELGRNMYQIYDRSMNQANYQSFVMERELRKAIMNNEFLAYFQPRVDAITGKVVGAEALIRWQHPEYGLVSPAQFIPLAEETGLIIPIGKWMKRKVCEQLVAWKNAGLPIIPISVNISSKRFLQREFAQDIRKLLTQFGLEGKWLEIEITENSIMRKEETVQKTLMDLKQMGVKIFIDDFGTGYSSFNYLKTFELDGLKIDRSFIQNISKKSENASITTAMIKMAQYLKLEVIAEGVETKEELAYLLEQNCRYIQGYYFGKPCPIDEFENKYLKVNTVF